MADYRFLEAKLIAIPAPAQPYVLQVFGNMLTGTSAQGKVDRYQVNAGELFQYHIARYIGLYCNGAPRVVLVTPYISAEGTIGCHRPDSIETVDVEALRRAVPEVQFELVQMHTALAAWLRCVRAKSLPLFHKQPLDMAAPLDVCIVDIDFFTDPDEQQPLSGDCIAAIATVKPEGVVDGDVSIMREELADPLDLAYDMATFACSAGTSQLVLYTATPECQLITGMALGVIKDQAGRDLDQVSAYTCSDAIQTGAKLLV